MSVTPIQNTQKCRKAELTELFEAAIEEDCLEAITAQYPGIEATVTKLVTAAREGRAVCIRDAAAAALARDVETSHLLQDADLKGKDHKPLPILGRKKE